jgi:hypothetical protein
MVFPQRWLAWFVPGKHAGQNTAVTDRLRAGQRKGRSHLSEIELLDIPVEELDGALHSGAEIIGDIMVIAIVFI